MNPVNDTGGEFITVVSDTGNTFMTGNKSLNTNISMNVHKNQNGCLPTINALGESDSCKNQMPKISCPSTFTQFKKRISAPLALTIWHSLLCPPDYYFFLGQDPLKPCKSQSQWDLEARHID